MKDMRNALTLSFTCDKQKIIKQAIANEAKNNRVTGERSEGAKKGNGERGGSTANLTQKSNRRGSGKGRSKKDPRKKTL